MRCRSWWRWCGVGCGAGWVCVGCAGGGRGGVWVAVRFGAYTLKSGRVYDCVGV